MKLLLPELVSVLAGGYSPLHFAACKGHTKLIKLLLDFWAELELRSKKGESVLLLAVQSGNLGTVGQLLDAHVDVAVQGIIRCK